MCTCEFINVWGNKVKVGKKITYDVKTRDEALKIMMLLKKRASHLGVQWFRYNNEYFQIT